MGREESEGETERERERVQGESGEKGTEGGRERGQREKGRAERERAGRERREKGQGERAERVRRAKGLGERQTNSQTGRHTYRHSIFALCRQLTQIRVNSKIAVKLAVASLCPFDSDT